MARRGRARRPPPVLTAAGLAVTALALLPLVYLVIRAGSAGTEAWRVLARPQTLELVARTTLLVTAVVVGATAIGVLLAWLAVRTDLPGARTWAVVAALPLVIPSYVTALALIAALGPGGPLPVPGIFGFPGAFAALTLATYPYVFLLTAAALRRSDPNIEEAARGLGRSRAGTFLAVTLPSLRGSIGSGGVLVALYALSDFGVVSLMRYDALTRAIYQQYRSLFDRTPAAVLGLVLVGLTALALAVEARGASERDGVSGGERAVAPTALGRWRWPALGLVTAVVGVALVVPVGVLLYWATRAQGATVPLHEVIAWAWHSLLASGLSALVASVAAMPVALLAARHAGGFARALERLTYASGALPGIVIALSLVFFATRLAEPLYQTLTLLVIAYVARFLPQAVAGSRGALAAIDPQLERAARGLGAGRLRVHARITAPLVAPGVLAGALLVFLSTMKELPATLLLRPTGFDTLATEIWTATTVSAYSRAAVPALVLIALSAPVVYALQVRPRRERGGPPAASAPVALAALDKHRPRTIQN